MSGTADAARSNAGTSARSASTGLAALVAATTMLFAALTSAYVVRRGLAGDWRPVPLPLLVPASVLLLILSSLALDQGQRNFRTNRGRGFAGMWFSGAALGIVFVLMLAYVWKQIGQSGISLASSPAAAFLCVLAGTFIVFLVATATAVIWAGLRACGGDRGVAHARLRLAANYWHYLDGLWIYLVILLYLRN